MNTLSTSKYRAIDVDSQLTSSSFYPMNYITPVVVSRANRVFEFESYGIPLTQSDSTVIPSNNRLGDCTDPNVFKVAIIDSGYMVNHPDSPCRDNPRYGTSNCIGYSFVEDPWDAPVRNWHGTHVMGIIGARGNYGHFTSVGVIPVQNDICYVIYRVTPEGTNDASWSNVLAAVDKAVLDEGVDVINMSLGGLGISGAQEYFTRAHEKGTLVVAASGNDGRYVDLYPSSYNDVISVGAINIDK
jgi:subtilisin family serine protease